MIALIDILAVGVTDDAGNPLASGTVRFYRAGTTTAVTVYQDYQQETPHANPATLDSGGHLFAYATDRVKLVIYDASGATIRTIDNVGFADSDIEIEEITVEAGDGLEEDDSGALAVLVDDTTIEITGGVVGLKADGVTQAHLADKTTASPAALGYDGLSSSTGDLAAITSTTAVAVTNLSVEKTVGGRSLELKLRPDGSTNLAKVRLEATGSTAVIGVWVGFYRDATLIGEGELNLTLGSAASTQLISVPPYVFQADDDTATAGTYTYSVKAYALNSSCRVFFKYCKLLVRET